MQEVRAHKKDAPEREDPVTIYQDPIQWVKRR